MPMTEQTCRAIVYARAQRRCELCSRPAESIHHRNKQGRVWLPSNTLSLCGDGVRRCHGWIEAHPTHAIMLGLWVPRHVHPATRPAWIHPTMWTQDWWTLDDDGMVGFVHATHPDPAAAYAAQVAFTTARGLPVPLPA